MYDIMFDKENVRKTKIMCRKKLYLFNANLLDSFLNNTVKVTVPISHIIPNIINLKKK